MRTPLKAKPISSAIAGSVRRYSHAVAWMKVLLPLGAVAVIATLFLSAQKQGDLTDIFTTEELITLGAGLRLDNPRFAGVTEQGEPYAIRADWALPDSAMPRLIDLERPKAEIDLKDGRTITASAATGRMHREEKMLVLEGGVVLDTSDGYHVETGLIEIYLASNTTNGPGPVSGTGPLSEIQAGSFRSSAVKGGAHNGQIWFENRVRLVFIPDQGGG